MWRRTVLTTIGQVVLAAVNKVMMMMMNSRRASLANTKARVFHTSSLGSFCHHVGHNYYLSTGLNCDFHCDFLTLVDPKCYQKGLGRRGC